MTRFLALALAALPSLAAGQTSTWTIDPAHSSSQFSVKHLVIATVRGQFGKTTGTIKLDEKDITRSSVEATVDVSTIDTRVAARDADLRSPNFFDVAKYPTMTFRSTKVEKAGDDKLKVSGDLTMHGTTRPVVWDVTYSPPTKGLAGEMRRGFAATSRIDRKQFGLRYSKTIEAGPVVGDQVDITVDAEAIEERPR